MLNFFPTLWFSIETVKDFAILLCHNKCCFSSYDMVLIYVHMRTFCKITLNHWTQLAVISPNIITKNIFITLSTILFILHTLFHYNVEVPCAYVKCCFALPLFQSFAIYILTQTSKKRKCDHNSILWMRKLRHSKVQCTP